MNVKGRSGIRYHSASYYYQLQGCIALGTKLQDIDGDGKLDLINSRNAIKLFEDFMKKETFTLEIK